MKLFKRVLTITVGDSAEAIIIKEPITISANIVKDIKTGEPDYAQVTIHNLSVGTRDKLNKKYQKIEIRGGYDGVSDLIFKADVVASTHKKEGSEWITTIECGDGAEALNQALVNKTYEEGFKLGDIIKDVANIGDLNLESILGLDENVSLTRGKSFSATTSDTLTELSNAYNFDWSVQDGKLNIIKRGSSRAIKRYIISARTGMVGSPEWINTGEDDQKTAKQTGLKFKVVSLLIPSVRPGDKITVKSESLVGRIGSYDFDVKRPEFTTDFIVSKVEHELNSRVGNFISKLECVSLVAPTPSKKAL